MRTGKAALRAASQAEASEGSPARRPVVLCADDFGYSAQVSATIASLAAAGRLSAVSCLTTGPDFAHSAARLSDLLDDVDVGLHLALTEFEPAGAMPRLAPRGRLPALGPLLRLCFARRIDPREVLDEFLRQLERFRSVFGRDPAFLDGHQHVHVLPTVRDAFVAMYRRAGLLPQATYVRNCAEPLDMIARRGVAVGKTAFIAALSAGFAKRAQDSGLPANDSFRGVYDFGSRRSFDTIFPRFLVGRGRMPLIMCHPGPDLAEIGDPIGRARGAELRYFASARFPDDLAAAGVRLARFSAPS